MRIVVIGAGAVGAYFGGRLAAAGEDVVFIARGANLAALRRQGVRIEIGAAATGVPLELAVTAVDDATGVGPADVVLVCVKSYDTAAAAAAVRPVVTPDTLVLSLQNGIENEAQLADALGLPPLLGGLTHIGAELIAPGVVRYDSGGRIFFGELDGQPSSRADRLVELLARAGISHHRSRHIAIMLWDKLAWNAAFNACTAVAQKTVGELLARADGRALVREAMLEVVAVANANGVPLDAGRVEPEIERSASALGTLRTSMLQDRDRGGRLEHDALNGAVLRAAQRAAVPAPVNRVLYGLLEVLSGQR
jgi:2-dehydropantoate 2-reductase